MAKKEGNDRKNIRILVSYHKPAILLKNDILTPIHAGRAVAKQPSKDGNIDAGSYNWLLENMIGDDTGDNISVKNRFYNEVTTIYWAWKNRKALDNPEYVGFMHYRRQFIFDDKKRDRYINYPFFAPESEYKIGGLADKDVTELFSEEQIVEAVSGADVLVAKPAEYDVSVYQQYADCKAWHVLSDLDCALQIIDEKYPEYSRIAKEYMKSHKHYFWNMFVMKWDIFDDYCKFLFGVLFEVEKRTDIASRSIVKQRIFAYLAERLTGIFIMSLKNKGTAVIKEKYSLFEEYTDFPEEFNPAFKEHNIPIVFSSDDNYAPYLSVAIKSLICNTSVGNNYDIFVIDEHISDDNKVAILKLIPVGVNNISIRFVNIMPYLRDISKSIFYCSGHFSISTYYRFFIPRLLKNFDKAVYLDCDITVLADIADLYNIDIKDNILGAAKDIDIIQRVWFGGKKWQKYFGEKLGIKNIEDYFQAGVLLLNLVKMREESFEQKCIDKLLEIKTPEFVDQDVLNSLYGGKIKNLPIEWNVEWHLPLLYPKLIEMLPADLYSEYMQGYKFPKIVHYCSIFKPWKSSGLPLARYFWEYARQTSFYENIIQRMATVEKYKSEVCKLWGLIPLFRKTVKKKKTTFYILGIPVWKTKIKDDKNFIRGYLFGFIPFVKYIRK